MKKIFAMMLAFAVVFSMAAPASAITTGNWDFGAIYDHIDWSDVTNPTDPEEPETEEPETDIGTAIAMVVVTYDYNGGYKWSWTGTTTSESTTVTITPGSGSYLTVTSTIPTKLGYKFGGWECNGTIYKSGDQIYVTDAMTLTAVWSR